MQKHTELRPKSNLYKDNNAYEMFMQGCSLTEICKKYSCTHSTLRRFLSSNYDIEFETKGALKYEHLSDNFKNEYVNGDSLQDISNRYNVSNQTVLNYLVRMQVPIRNYEMSSRSIAILDSYFDSIDSEEKAYILGMIYATSKLRVAHKSKYVEITVKKEHTSSILSLTQKFCEKGIEQLERKDKSESKILRVYSSQIYRRLDELGISQQLPVDKIENKYLEVFFKGLFAYSISVNKRNLHISCEENYTDSIEEQLAKLGIKSRMYNSFIVIENRDDLRKFIKSYPFALEYIRRYISINPTVSKWNNFVKAYQLV